MSRVGESRRVRVETIDTEWGSGDEGGAWRKVLFGVKLEVRKGLRTERAQGGQRESDVDN